MNKPGQSHLSPETPREHARLNRAVRRTVRLRAELPSLRSMLRACGVYANVIAAVVALGLPTVRQAAGSAATAFESAVRTARESTAALPELLAVPADLSFVTEPMNSTADTVAVPGHALMQDDDTAAVEVGPSPETDAERTEGTGE